MSFPQNKNIVPADFPETVIDAAHLSGNGFVSISRSPEELSIVRQTATSGDASKEEAGWRLFKVIGPLDFGLTGVIASISAPLATARISIFVVSTFDTDYFMVKREKTDDAIRALALTGFTVERD